MLNELPLDDKKGRGGLFLDEMSDGSHVKSGEQRPL
jgi:hypothetical protein